MVELSNEYKGKSLAGARASTDRLQHTRAHRSLSNIATVTLNSDPKTPKETRKNKTHVVFPNPHPFPTAHFCSGSLGSIHEHR